MNNITDRKKDNELRNKKFDEIFKKIILNNYKYDLIVDNSDK